MSFCTKKFEIEIREKNFPYIFGSSHIFLFLFIHLPQSFSRSLTLCHVLLPKKVMANSFSYIYKYWEQSLYDILKQSS